MRAEAVHARQSCMLTHPASAHTHGTGCPETAFSAAGVLEVTEAVPFRLTPNLQHFITPVGLEGIFSASLMAIARSLADPEVRSFA